MRRKVVLTWILVAFLLLLWPFYELYCRASLAGLNRFEEGIL